MLVDTSPGGECSIDSTYHVDMPKSTIASRGGIGLRAQMGRAARRFSPRSRLHTQVHRIDATAGVAAVGVSRVGAERERGIISLMSSVRPFDPIVRRQDQSRRVQTRARSA